VSVSNFSSLLELFSDENAAPAVEEARVFSFAPSCDVRLLLSVVTVSIVDERVGSRRQLRASGQIQRGERENCSGRLSSCSSLHAPRGRRTCCLGAGDIRAEDDDDVAYRARNPPTSERGDAFQETQRLRSAMTGGGGGGVAAIGMYGQPAICAAASQRLDATRLPKRRPSEPGGPSADLNKMTAKVDFSSRRRRLEGVRDVAILSYTIHRVPMATRLLQKTL
jgi:hypothetical protein